MTPQEQEELQQAIRDLSDEDIELIRTEWQKWQYAIQIAYAQRWPGDDINADYAIHFTE